ncbi:hypothetical protein D3800_20305 [Microcystis aeruginosa NIES-298]|jgi:hypothetical protein|uniref:Uncharacterized protein n=3 Tax=Microcystis aeruginosa TaxID=1126 RepID=A0A5A5R114_MICAE|nr:hypothetical protein [Microcystis aeruginosa]ELP54194.1 hypothetical protein O53_3010 [Microcystis aeruginosa TAIHU98]QHU85432.1 hypothetical protein D3800_20305 [Microcystis aeruginosa NIES-298]GBD52717.1 hypothetical protein BGM30_18100 [Microcystis aeruginosa NIES-298]GBE97863.1 hypothetical protein NIES298_21110 [Microcystis aeruginosa NIES-298]GCA69070.1 hypothetical protein MiYa_00592 [Microcystis aeruginosa NIES-2519]
MSFEYKIKKYEDSIYGCAFMAAGIGAPGSIVPGLDIGGVSGTWAGMILGIAKIAERQLDKNTVLKFVGGILAGSAGYLGGSKVLTFALHAVPGIGTLGAVGINCLLNFIYTIRLGRYVALQMEKPGFDTQDWADLIPEITALVFAMPTVTELREAWKYYNDEK